jgi:beta-N-acetylhexosaminidase
MTSQNQQPQGPSPFDRSSGRPSTINSSWTTTQTIHTNSSLQQQSPLPEQKVPAWVAPSRPMPAAEYQHDASTAQLTSSPLSLAYELSNPLTANGPGQTFPSKRHRLRTFFILFMLMLSLLVALSAVLGPNLFAKVPGSASNSLPALGASGPFVKAPLNADQINAIMHLSGYMKFKQLASIYVSHMTLDEELGQLIMVEYADTSYSSDLDTMINKLHAGGVIMYEFQMNTFDQTKHDIAEMQQRSSIPLLISTDEEGGPYVHRLSHIYGYRMSATDIANTHNPEVATQQGTKAAHDLLALGINENLAPDVDVNLVNGYDMVTRTFGKTPQSVITYAGAYMKALQANGVVACIKHFPGLGDATPDAHTTLPVVNRTRDQIYSVELAPFKAFIQSPDKLLNPGMIMPTDVLMPAIDPVYPAELSHIFMTDILRKQCGYDGVVLTDALYMQGITQKWSMYQAAVMALNAGNDMILGPTGADQMLATINALKTALQNGTLSKARVDEAATRIIALKMQDHLMPALPTQG